MNPTLMKISETLMKIIEWLMLRILVEWVLMRLLWGPWNVLVAVVWAINDDVAEDVVAARLLLGTLGSIFIAVWIFGSPHASTTLEMGFLSVLCAGTYAFLAGVLKLTLSGRDEHIFSLPR